MEKSGPFNAELKGEEWDRVYLSEDLAEWIRSILSNGVYPNPATCLQVISIDNDMRITLQSGIACILGRFYHNTDNIKFLIEPADGVLNRIDRVILRLDYLNREIKAYVKKGTYAATAIAPELQRDADAYELGIADVFVGRGVIKINQSNITDLRLNKDYCGIVHGAVEQVDTTEIFRQYQAWFLENKTKHEGDFEAWMNEFKITTGQKFTDWVNDLKNSLDPNSDVAAQLQMQVSKNKQDIESQKAALIYQTPTIVGSQIQIIKHSNVNRLYFKLDTNLTGNITISLDSGVTEKPLKDIEGVQLTELEKGFVEVVADATFFTLRSRSGLSSADKQSLIDIVNRGLSNESDLKTSIINALNTVNTEGGKISTSALWSDVLNGIPNIKTGKKWASGMVTSSSSEYPFIDYLNTTHQKYKVIVNGLTFEPSFIHLYPSVQTAMNDTFYNKSRIYGNVQDAHTVSLGTILFAKTNENLIVTNGSYTLPVNNRNLQYCWIAME